jgi:hypothetical protein
MLRRLLPCLLGAVALHAAALGWLAHAADRPAGIAAPLPAQAAHPASRMQVTLRPAADRPAAPALAEPSGLARHGAQAAPGVAPPLPGHGRLAGEEGAAQADRTTAAGAGAPADTEGYVPRPLLTTAPEPLQDIALPFPLDFTTRGRFAGILTLYIEADGRVSRVVVEGASLPPPLARVAQQAFTGTRFSPGRVAQRIVKSRIRVEVVFDHPQAA